MSFLYIWLCLSLSSSFYSLERKKHRNSNCSHNFRWNNMFKYEKMLPIIVSNFCSTAISKAELQCLVANVCLYKFHFSSTLPLNVKSKTAQFGIFSDSFGLVWRCTLLFKKRSLFSARYERFTSNININILSFKLSALKSMRAYQKNAFVRIVFSVLDVQCTHTPQIFTEYTVHKEVFINLLPPTNQYLLGSLLFEQWHL